MIIPWQLLDEYTLNNIIESFILREGTDYGWEEKSLEEKKLDVKKQIELGQALIIWSELHETVDIKSKNEVITSEALS